MPASTSCATAVPDAARLLALAAPDHRLCTMELCGRAAGVLTDGRGLTAVLELERPTTLGGPLGGDPDVTVTPLLTVLPGAPGAAAPLAVHSVLAVRVDAADDPDPEPVRQRLAAALRQVRPELPPSSGAPLDPPTLATVLTELAHYGSCEGDLHQAGFRLPSVGGAGGAFAGCLPAVVTLGATGSGAALRLAARTSVDLARAEERLRAVATGAGPIRRIRGRRPGWLGATLPLGRTGVAGGLPLPPAPGVPLGTDRAGRPALQPLLGHARTRVLMITERSAHRRLRDAVVAAGVRAGEDPTAGPGTPATPVLRQGDEFPTAATRWCTDLVVRPPEEPVPAELLLQADVVVTRPLPEPQAARVSAVLGLGRAGAWLRADRPDLLATVTPAGVRWAHLDRTAGDPGPGATGGRR